METSEIGEDPTKQEEKFYSGISKKIRDAESEARRHVIEATNEGLEHNQEVGRDHLAYVEADEKWRNLEGGTSEERGRQYDEFDGIKNKINHKYEEDGVSSSGAGEFYLALRLHDRSGDITKKFFSSKEPK